ncbi:MAG: nuclear transport factor 2 family protein [Anaerolineae bacterium]|nr:nuclear transport factor 2 family protein [Anaerolineae bacterium]MCA9907380.1 nuclear transport factor 2 family protein [Anaerolineae bacterium]
MDIESTIDSYFQIVDARQFDELVHVFHREIEYERPGFDKLIGVEAVIDFYKNTRDIAAGHHELYGKLVCGQTAACWGRFEGSKKDGSRIDERFSDILTFEQGKMRTRVTFFFRPAI